MLGFGGEAVAAVDAPSGHRLDLLAPGAPLRAELGLPDGRFERHRVCDALLFRRRLPLYPVPSASQALANWERWIGVGFELFAALAPLGLYRPDAGGAVEGRVEHGALRFGRLCETYPDAVFCSMIGHRPPPKRTPWGLQQRIAALRVRGVVDADGGLWHRTLDELDACAAAYAAYALASGGGIAGSATRARASSCCPSTSCCRATTRCRRRRARRWPDGRRSSASRRTGPASTGSRTSVIRIRLGCPTAATIAVAATSPEAHHRWSVGSAFRELARQARHSDAEGCGRPSRLTVVAAPRRAHVAR